MTYKEINRYLVDRNSIHLVEHVAQKIRDTNGFVGVDCETQDTGRHDGLNRYCGYREDGTKSKTKPLVFDTRKTVITGFSIYIEDDDDAYYFNLAHSDTENRLSQPDVDGLLQAISAAKTVAHNAAYEIMSFKSLGVTFDDILCTLQLAASAYGPDEYSREDFLTCGKGTLGPKYAESIEVCRDYEGDRNEDPAVGKLFASVLAKESKADSSYNGFVKDLAFSYGLKKAVRKFCGYEMASFEDTLQGKPHMGALTGQEAAYYGCDDAVWCVRLLAKLVEYASLRSPEVIQTYFEQEKPMVPVYADLWTTGCRIDLDAVNQARDRERRKFVEVITQLHTAINNRLPFPREFSAGLMKYEKWYQKNAKAYRDKLIKFANRSIPSDIFEAAQLVRSPVSNVWATEQGKPESTGPNLGHYMVMRTILYDLCGLEPVIYQGKVQSDAEARGGLLEAAVEKNHPSVEILKLLSELSRVDQAMKLYLNPYLDLTDPETERVYPLISSELATRRMAGRYPNPMQLSKYGESKYVRGFYLPDSEDEVLVSLDWSGVELVLIGELSGDPIFAQAYAQLPHGDLHIEAASEFFETDVETLKEIRGLDPEEFTGGTHLGIDLVDYRGRPLSPEGFWKYARSTSIGKGMNFGYFYSGSLHSIGKIHGWDQERTWEVTERYRDKFAVAEEWRVGQQMELRQKGYVKLPDGHRRYRYECTEEWKRSFLDKFHCSWEPGVNIFWSQCADSIQRRGGNQGVNALIQGTCATLLKRSILKIYSRLRAEGWSREDARFKIPVHDELVWSVHRDKVVDFIRLAKTEMVDHPDICQQLKLDTGVSVGLSFQPYDLRGAPYGQVEIDDLPSIPGVVPAGGSATEAELRSIVDHLFRSREDEAV